MSAIRPAVAATVTSLVGACVWAVGRKPLPPPPLLQPTRWIAWWQGSGPLTALFSLVRLAVLGSVAAVAVVSVAVLVSRVLAAGGRSGPACWRRFAGWAEGGGRNRLATLVLGLSASGGVLAGCGATGPVATAAGGREPEPPPPVLVAPSGGRAAGLVLGPGQAGTPVSPNPGSTPHSGTKPGPIGGTAPAAPALSRPAVSAPAVSPRVPARPPVTTPAAPRAAEPSPRASTVPARRTPAAARSGPQATWTVRPGDDFWSIAETVVGRAGSPPDRPDQRAVARYWTRLVAANTARLPVPGHPDLLFPGDVVLLPPLAGPAVAPD